MQNKITCAEEAALHRERLAALNREHGEIEKKLIPLDRQLNRWYQEWTGQNDYEKEKREYNDTTDTFVSTPIWTDINNGPLQPIPIETLLPEIEAMRLNLVCWRRESDLLKQCITDYNVELKKFYRTREKDVIKNLKEWYYACNKFRVNLQNPVFVFASERSNYPDFTYRFLQEEYERDLFDMQFKKRYVDIVSDNTNGVVNVTATRTKNNKAVTYVLDDFFDSIAQYTEAAVMGLYREMQINSVLD